MSKLNGKQLLNSSTSLNVLSGVGSVAFTSATLSFATQSVLQIDSTKVFTYDSDVVNKKYVDSRLATNFNNKYYINPLEDVYVPTYSQYFIFGDMKVDGNIDVDGQLVVLNGDLDISGGGSYSIGPSGSISLLEISTIYDIVAGTALSGGGNTGIVTLNVNVDNATIGVNGNDELFVLSSYTASEAHYLVGVTASSGLNTNQNGLYTGIDVNATTNNTNHINVFVNGQEQLVGNGTTASCDCYFGPNAGTARTYITITSGDKFFWNAVHAGFALESDDIIDIKFNKNS